MRQARESIACRHRLRVPTGAPPGTRCGHTRPREQRHSSRTRAVVAVGGEVPRRDRVYCDDCLPHHRREQFATAFHGSGLRAIEQARAEGNDPTHGAKAAVARAATNVERKREARKWDERYGKLTDLSPFTRDILPLIQGVPLSRLQRATGLSLRYVSLIRRGEKTPHPRHWQALITAADYKAANFAGPSRRLTVRLTSASACAGPSRPGDL
jgi:hypothetical protein